MPLVRYLPAAISDLHDIWLYIYRESGSLVAADGIVERIDETAQAYAQQPLLGELRTELADHLRSFVIGNYVGFYLPRENGIEIIQIIHGARDIPAHFRSRW
jgi:toxin ParE1/3/4